MGLPRTQKGPQTQNYWSPIKYQYCELCKIFGGRGVPKCLIGHAIYCWPLVVDEEPPVSLHTGGKPAQGWPNNQKRAFSPLQCGETLYNSLVAGKMRQTTCYCCLAVVAFFALFVFCFVPFGVSFISVFHGVFWVVRITLCNAWLVGASWLWPFHCWEKLWTLQLGGRDRPSSIWFRKWCVWGMGSLHSVLHFQQDVQTHCFHPWDKISVL